MKRVTFSLLTIDYFSPRNKRIEDILNVLNLDSIIFVQIGQIYLIGLVRYICLDWSDIFDWIGQIYLIGLVRYIFD